MQTSYVRNIIAVTLLTILISQTYTPYLLSPRLPHGTRLRKTKQRYEHVRRTILPSVRERGNKISRKEDTKAEIGAKLKTLLESREKHDTLRLLIDLRKRGQTGIEGVHRQWRESIHELEKKPLKRAFEEYEKITDTMRRRVYERLREKTRITRERAKKRIKTLGGEILGEIVTINSIIARVKVKKIDALKEFSLVQGIYVDRDITIALDVATNTTRFPSWWGHDYNGSNYKKEGAVDVAVLDTGINKSHPALQGKVIDEKSFVDGEGPQDFDGHGTHVAGILASQNESYTGAGYGAQLLNGKFMKGREGNVSDLMEAAEWSVTTDGETADVISTSLGADAEPNGTSYFTKFVDAFIDYYKVVWCTAAGNAGSTSEAITLPGDGYNVLTVGATNDKNTVHRSDDGIWAGSSRGPTTDGRIKPEIVAPGVDITSCNASFNSSGDYWDPLTGTSMATPLVSGAAAVILPYVVTQYNFTNPTLPVKALLINSAWNMSEPLRAQGFGYLDLTKAWQDRGHLHSSTVSEGETEHVWTTLNAGENFTASLVWNKNLDTYAGGDSSFYSVSDLNLALHLPNGSQIAVSNSTNNTVEQIHLVAPESGFYRLDICGKSVSSALEEEKIALAASHRLFSTPLRVKLKSIRGMLRNKSIKAHANITNLADRNFTDLYATLDLPEGINLASGNGTSALPVLAPNESYILNWTIAPYIAGTFTYNLTVNASIYEVPLEITRRLMIMVNESDLGVESFQMAVNVSETTTIKANITSFVSGNISDIECSLYPPLEIILLSRRTVRERNLQPKTPLIVSWEVAPQLIGNFTYTLLVNSSALASPIQKEEKLVVRDRKDKIEVTPYNITGELEEATSLSVNVTNLAEVPLHNVTLRLSPPEGITLSTRKSITRDEISSSSSISFKWTITLAKVGTFEYNVTVTSPEIAGKIMKSGEIVIQETSLPWKWILGLGGLVGGLIIVLYLSKKRLRKTPKKR